MSFWGILILVLVGLIILSLLFAVFKFFISLLPVAIILAVIVWAIFKFERADLENDQKFNHIFDKSGRKTARHVKVKDVDHKKDHKK